MNSNRAFEEPSEEQQEHYAREAAGHWGQEIVQASNQRWKAYSAAEKERIRAEGSAVYADLAKAQPKGAASAEVQAVIARWHAHLNTFWSPNDAQLLGLADLYNNDARFRSYYEKVAPGLAEFMREAVRVYVDSRRN